ncbi:MAG: LapA family protein [Candidatus Krumholzibacteria bacterium]|nr:LapA family protein [Candidatus Krumholzibacteria bacterium]
MKEFFKRPKVIAIIVVSVLALILLFQNIDIVTFRVFFWSGEVSQLVLVILMLAIGYILGFLTAKLGGKKE